MYFLETRSQNIPLVTEKGREDRDYTMSAPADIAGFQIFLMSGKKSCPPYIVINKVNDWYDLVG